MVEETVLCSYSKLQVTSFISFSFFFHPVEDFGFLEI